jgi:F420-non-reducing hydrogenase iron-sulfur subunit
MAGNVGADPKSGNGGLPRWEPRIVAFLCYWCSYTGADNAGTARMKYPPYVDIIRVMCSGRIDPAFVTRAFASGADGVMVCGCHIGDCHYIAGNHKTMARMPLLKRVLVEMGIEEDRFLQDWVSAAEGEKFARLVRTLSDRVQRLGPLNWPGRELTEAKELRAGHEEPCAEAAHAGQGGAR